MGSALITPHDAKDRGNEAFKQGEFSAASWWYSRGIQTHEMLHDLNETQVQFLSTLYSNRSATFLEMGYLDTSLSDAHHAMMINPTWEKPYYRAAMCQMELDQLDEASTSLAHAHAISPKDKSILLARQKLFDAYRKKQQDGQAPGNSPTHLPSITKQQGVIATKRKRRGHGALLTWGRGEFGCLGHSDSKDQHIPRMVDGLRGRAVRDVACGAHHSVFIDVYGSAWSWGLNTSGECGLGRQKESGTFTSPHILSPVLVPDLVGHEVVAVTCGEHHTVAIVVDKKSRPITLVSDSNRVQPPSLLYGVVTTDHRHEHLYKSQHHLHSKGNKVYSWGKGCSGQLGHGSTDNCDYPKEIEELSLCSTISVGVACGSEHSCLIDSNGDLWVWGEASQGRLGLSSGSGVDGSRLEKGSLILLPTVVDRGDNVEMRSSKPSAVMSAINVNSKNTTVSGRDGGVSVSGGMHHVSGNKVQCEKIDIPNPSICSPPSLSHDSKMSKLVHVSCGHRHTVVIDSQGRAFSTGANQYGQLGVGDNASRSNFSQVIGFPSAALSKQAVASFSSMPASPSGSFLNDPAASVHCGANNTFIITRLKQVFAFGEGSGGMLGDGVASPSHQRHTPWKIDQLDKVNIEQVCPARWLVCSNDAEMPSIPKATLAVSSSGEVFGWGPAVESFNRSPHGKQGGTERPTPTHSDDSVHNINDKQREQKDYDESSQSSRSNHQNSGGVSLLSPKKILMLKGVLRILYGKNHMGALIRSSCPLNCKVKFNLQNITQKKTPHTIPTTFSDQQHVNTDEVDSVFHIQVNKDTASDTVGNTLKHSLIGTNDKLRTCITVNANELFQFTVTVYNEFGEIRKDGGDCLNVSLSLQPSQILLHKQQRRYMDSLELSCCSPRHSTNPSPLSSRSVNTPLNTGVSFSIMDLRNGSYVCEATPIVSGDYDLSVMVDHMHVLQSPYTCYVQPSISVSRAEVIFASKIVKRTHASFNTSSTSSRSDEPSLVLEARSGDELNFTVCLLDSHDNPCLNGIVMSEVKAAGGGDSLSHIRHISHPAHLMLKSIEILPPKSSIAGGKGATGKGKGKTVFVNNSRKQCSEREDAIGSGANRSLNGYISEPRKEGEEGFICPVNMGTAGAAGAYSITVKVAVYKGKPSDLLNIVTEGDDVSGESEVIDMAMFDFQHIRGSPFRLSVLAGPPCPSLCRCYGEGTMKAIALCARDAHDEGASTVIWGQEHSKINKQHGIAHNTSTQMIDNVFTVEFRDKYNECTTKIDAASLNIFGRLVYTNEINEQMRQDIMVPHSKTGLDPKAPSCSVERCWLDAFDVETSPLVRFSSHQNGTGFMTGKYSCPPSKSIGQDEALLYVMIDDEHVQGSPFAVKVDTKSDPPSAVKKETVPLKCDTKHSNMNESREHMRNAPEKHIQERGLLGAVESHHVEEHRKRTLFIESVVQKSQLLQRAKLESYSHGRREAEGGFSVKFSSS